MHRGGEDGEAQEGGSVKYLLFSGLTLQELQAAVNEWATTIKPGTQVTSGMLMCVDGLWVKEIVYIEPVTGGLAVPVTQMQGAPR